MYTETSLLKVSNFDVNFCNGKNKSVKKKIFVERFIRRLRSMQVSCYQRVNRLSLMLWWFGTRVGVSGGAGEGTVYMLHVF